MKTVIKIEKEVDIQVLEVIAKVRYWEDSKVNGEEDTDGELIPCVNGENWCPEIDVDKGIILNWEKGKTAEIHYKVCDGGIYRLIDTEGETVLEKDGYVPGTMSPGGSGYGDYIIMNVDENGLIDNWGFDIEDFIDEE